MPSAGEPARAAAFAVVINVAKRGPSLQLRNERFSRERLAGYDPDRMNGSTVLLVGAGALGQNTAMNLALAGIGEIRIVDRDRFEEHNRTRSPAYPFPEEKEIYGMDKARAVAGKLRRLMTASRPVMRYANNWIQELGDGAFQGVSVVVSCVDSQLARAYLSDKARQHELPFIEGGFEGENLTLTSFPRVQGEAARSEPCWRCSNLGVYAAFSCRNYAAQAEAAGIVPAIQDAAATLGGLQAEAAVLAIHSNLEAKPMARSFSLNIRSWQSHRTKLVANGGCVGAHCAFDHNPTALTTTSCDSVRQLLTEISGLLGKSARIVLPINTYSRLVWKAPCGLVTCGKMAAVRSPEWRWIMSQRCSECGGPFPVIEGAKPSSPDIYSELTLDSNHEVLDASCKEIGLPALSIVAATDAQSSIMFYDRSNSLRLFQLPGSLDELYQRGDLK